MPDGGLPFEAAEYRARVGAVQQRMAERGIDVLLVVDPCNLNYLTGYEAWSFYVPQAVIVVRGRDDPIWVGRRMDASTAAMTTYLGDDDIQWYEDGLVDSPGHHPFARVAELLHDGGWGNATIGVETDAYYFTARSLETLQARMPNASFEDAYLLVNWIRAVKSDREISYMRDAARIVETAMATGIGAVGPEVRECDVVGEIVKAQISGTGRGGGVYPAAWPHYLVGDRAGTPHATWTDAPHRVGEGTCLELGGCRFRYHAALARTVYLGTPPAALVDLAALVGDGMHAVIDAIRPGVQAHDVDGAWRRIIEAAGQEKPSRIGYSIGIGYPPVWGEHTVSIREGDETVLVPNMTFHVILGMWMDGWGYELSETIRVDRSGAEVLTRFPRELVVK